MLHRTQCYVRAAKRPKFCIQWQRVPARFHASNADDPPWFQELRTEMLGRDVTYIEEDITAQPGIKLSNTLSEYLPDKWCRAPDHNRPVLPISHYLIWFNPSLPEDRLLPDGTDMLHSPGGPWIRRMWAGGSVTVKPLEYFSRKGGFVLNSTIVSAERIQDVQLRGKDEDTKIFVTLERQFAKLDTLFEHHRRALGVKEKSNRINVQRYFKQRLRDDAAWEDALFKDERTLVFLKERPAAEIEAIKAAPGKPDFSHTLTPTRSLLFRYSALTFNAHLIHLDRTYARAIEGHRSLLVHGPLSLTIMTQAISSYLDTEMKGRQVFESIEYRNLAPLYCDEEMRVCGKLKKTIEDGHLYDIWIEGIPGGVAVKGVVRTMRRRSGFKEITTTNPSSCEADFQKNQHLEDLSSDEVQEISKGGLVGPDKGTPANSSLLDPTQANEAFQELSTASTPPTKIEQHSGDILPPQKLPSSTQIDPFIPLLPHLRARNPTHLTRSHSFILPASNSPPIHQVRAPPARVKPRFSLPSRNILERAAARHAPKNQYTPPIEPIPLLRKYAATPYSPHPEVTAERHSRFKRQGARFFEHAGMRLVGQSMEEIVEETAKGRWGIWGRKGKSRGRSRR